MTDTYDSLSSALDSLPEDARWSSSFGLQTEGGCVIVYRAPDRRWSIENGAWDAFAPFTWTIRETAT